jgi:CRP-like cAMP-binding protein
MSGGGSARRVDEPWCGDCPFRDPLPSDAITKSDLVLIEKRPAELKTAPAGTLLIREHEQLSSMYLLTSGWAQRFIPLPDGQQVILQLFFPGDIIGYGAALLRIPPHYSAAALTAVTYHLIDPERVAAVFTTAPALARKFMIRLVRRQRVIDYRLLNLARRKVDERLATLLLYVFARQRRLGLLRDHAFNLPLSQHQIGDIVGANAIHVNRMLRQLRENGLVTLQRGEARIHDLAGLRRLGCFCADRSASSLVANS